MTNNPARIVASSFLSRVATDVDVYISAGPNFPSYADETYLGTVPRSFFGKADGPVDLTDAEVKAVREYAWRMEGFNAMHADGR